MRIMDTMTRCDYQRACTSGETGTSLIEVVATVAILGLLILGLASVYVFGLDSWQKTEDTMRLQQNGTYLINYLSRDADGGALIDCTDDELTITYPKIDGLLQSQSVVYKLEDGRVFRQDVGGKKQIMPFSEMDSSITVKDHKLWTYNEPNHTIEVQALLILKSGSYSEEMAFTTTIHPRNSWLGKTDE